MRVNYKNQVFSLMLFILVIQNCAESDHKNKINARSQVDQSSEAVPDADVSDDTFYANNTESLSVKFRFASIRADQDVPPQYWLKPEDPSLLKKGEAIRFSPIWSAPCEWAELDSLCMGYHLSSVDSSTIQNYPGSSPVKVLTGRDYIAFSIPKRDLAAAVNVLVARAQAIRGSNETLKKAFDRLPRPADRQHVLVLDPPFIVPWTPSDSMPNAQRVIQMLSNMSTPQIGAMNAQVYPTVRMTRILLKYSNGEISLHPLGYENTPRAPTATSVANGFFLGVSNPSLDISGPGTPELVTMANQAGTAIADVLVADFVAPKRTSDPVMVEFTNKVGSVLRVPRSSIVFDPGTGAPAVKGAWGELFPLDQHQYFAKVTKAKAVLDLAIPKTEKYPLRVQQQAADGTYNTKARNLLERGRVGLVFADVHLTADSNFISNIIAQDFLTFVSGKAGKFEYALVGGDIGDKSVRNQTARETMAAEWLGSFRQAVGLSRNRIFLAMGNHDADSPPVVDGRRVYMPMAIRQTVHAYNPHAVMVTGVPDEVAMISLREGNVVFSHFAKQTGSQTTLAYPEADQKKLPQQPLFFRDAVLQFVFDTHNTVQVSAKNVFNSTKSFQLVNSGPLGAITKDPCTPNGFAIVDLDTLNTGEADVYFYAYNPVLRTFEPKAPDWDRTK